MPNEGGWSNHFCCFRQRVHSSLDFLFLLSLPRKVLVLQVIIGVAFVCAPGLDPFMNLLATGSLYPGSLIRCVLDLIARKYALEQKNER